MNEQLQNDLKAELEKLEEQNLLWNPKTLEGPSAPHSQVAGKDVIMLCSNNYLGISNQEIVKNAAIEAVKKYGAGSGSVRAIAGTMDLHLKLEETLAKFKKTEEQWQLKKDIITLTALKGHFPLTSKPPLNSCFP